MDADEQEFRVVEASYAAVLEARMRCTIGEITQAEYFAVLNPFLDVIARSSEGGITP